MWSTLPIEIIPRDRSLPTVTMSNPASSVASRFSALSVFDCVVVVLVICISLWGTWKHGLKIYNMELIVRVGRNKTMLKDNGKADFCSFSSRIVSGMLNKLQGQPESYEKKYVPSQPV